MKLSHNQRFLGVYFYKTHPVSQVDVLGTVVCKREREDFYCYGGNLSVKSMYVL